MNVSPEIWDEIRTCAFLTEAQITSLYRILTKYDLGNLIFPGVVKKGIHTNIKIVYIILGILEKHGLIEKNYEYYCHVCGKFYGDIYETIGDIPEEVYCESCETELVFEKNAVIIYRVMHSGK